MTNPMQPVWLDRGPGSGSLTWEEAMRDATSGEQSNDGRSKTRTTFYQKSDTTTPPMDHHSWTSLASINDGVGDPDRAKRNHQADKRRVISTLCSRLECTDHQQERTAHIIGEIENLREFYPTAPMQTIILGAISLAVDEDTTDFDNWIVHRDSFQSLLDDIDEDLSTIWTIRKKLQEECDSLD